MFWTLPSRLTLTESIPEGMSFPSGSPHLQSITHTWTNLLNRANTSVNIAAFYLTLRDSDIGLIDPSAMQVKQLWCVGLHGTSNISHKFILYHTHTRQAQKVIILPSTSIFTPLTDVFWPVWMYFLFQGKVLLDHLKQLESRGVNLKIAVNAPQTYRADTDELTETGRFDRFTLFRISQEQSVLSFDFGIQVQRSERLTLRRSLEVSSTQNFGLWTRSTCM